MVLKRYAVLATVFPRGRDGASKNQVFAGFFSTYCPSDWRGVAHRTGCFPKKNLRFLRAGHVFSVHSNSAAATARSAAGSADFHAPCDVQIIHQPCKDAAAPPSSKRSEDHCQDGRAFQPTPCAVLAMRARGPQAPGSSHRTGVYLQYRRNNRPRRGGAASRTRTSAEGWSLPASPLAPSFRTRRFHPPGQTVF